jgi:hypothetical protein
MRFLISARGSRPPAQNGTIAAGRVKRRFEGLSKRANCAFEAPAPGEVETDFPLRLRADSDDNYGPVAKLSHRSLKSRASSPFRFGEGANQRKLPHEREQTERG